MRKGLTVFAALTAASLATTALVMGASNALATPDHTMAVEEIVAVTPIEVAPVAAMPAAETCARKVRVVYSGYATPAGCAR
ncbi:hypothetical protein LNAOJCKE_2312 [Methylorubrum aminovorans]|uniref:Porin n=1 Tax=Methylorubrum aminovorans TaxID=269069 RepID=A0ABQ4UDL3_9HYPH|nr:hypothetical protein [Methylorubrum aminovorans]GJE65103.1 hypothetical protein LNAOJCKE_2312 [Methylorubrum aminovorans]GMA73745.1 hypothetical protein GCM10025880_01620 [Methylorubrum aminovorans]